MFPVTIGQIESPNSFRHTLDLLGATEVTSKANDILDRGFQAESAHFFHSSCQNDLLADVSVEELGLFDNSMYEEILATGVGREVVWEGTRYELSKVVPAHLLALRVKYISQPKNEWLRGAMDGVEHPMGNMMLFRLVHGKNGVMYFDTDDGGDLDDPFDDHVRFLWRLVPVVPTA